MKFYSGEPCSCPLGRFLNEITPQNFQVDVTATVFDVYPKTRDDEIFYENHQSVDTPKWAGEFVRAFDSSVSDVATGKQALEILNRVRKP